MELPDCELAAQHFVSQTFWEQDNKKTSKIAKSIPSGEPLGEVDASPATMGPQQFRSEAQFQAVYTQVQDELRATMMDVFLHTEFQSLLEQAQTLIDERTNQSCGKAKGMLLKALNNPLL